MIDLTLDDPTAEAARGRQRPPEVRTRIAIVGTGFSGLGLAMKLKAQGHDDFVVLERADDVGGTWRDNTYPGAACDVPSHLYSFSFAPNPGWTTSFSPQPEILAYLRRCADESGVRPHIRFGHHVDEARWDDTASVWRVRSGALVVVADVLVTGMGALSTPKSPAIPGIERFAGTTFHSARWDHDHDLAGERIAVIGTGASAIQFVPEIQPAAARVDIYQRTAPWVIPRNDRSLSFAEHALFARVPAAQLAARAAIYWTRELSVAAFRRPDPLMKTPQNMAARHIDKYVKDPVLRAKVTPDYTIGCKRILISNDWYPAIIQPNVAVVTDGIAEVCEHTIVDRNGVEREVDTIIFGTGFDAAGFPFGDVVYGRDGRNLGDVWKQGADAYLGTAVAGFPNLFTMFGPNTGLGHNSMVFMFESQFNYVLDALDQMTRRRVATVEVRPEAQRQYNRQVQAALKDTVWMTGGCASWYLDERGYNSTLWPQSTWTYRRRTRYFDITNYRTTTRPLVGRPAVTAETGPAALPDERVKS